MCILFIAVKQHPDYPLIIAANRDEFHQRPTLPSHFWSPSKDILAGKDQSANGSWMGINRSGKIAALTNIRAPGKERANAVTRGKLVIDFLNDAVSSQEYQSVLEDTRNDYNGYNLLFGSVKQLFVFNNFTNKTQALDKGVYGLSNAMLNTPWPKLDFGKETLAKYCQSPQPLDISHLFELLRNDTPAKDDVLPKTGVPIEWERKLSSIFIQSPEYGTRSSTVLLVDNENKVQWHEKTFAADTAIINQQAFTFDIK